MKKEFTSSVYILDNQKVLLIFHQKLQKWLPPGGHVELNETPPEAARREVMEETGLEIEFLTQENLNINYLNAKSIERPYLCLLEEIPSYKGMEAHQHIDFVFVAKPITDHHFDECKWLDYDQLLLLKPDIEIFQETLDVIKHLFENFSSIKTTYKITAAV